MARKPRYDPWKGKSAQELSTMNPNKISSMDTRDLRALVTRLSSAANKRMRSMAAHDETSPEYARAEKAGRFSAKGKTDLGLVHEYLRVSQFLRTPTTTIKGARYARKEGMKKAAKVLGLREDYLTSMTEEQQKLYWKMFSRYADVFKNYNIVNYKTGLARAVKGMVTAGYSEETIGKALSEEASTLMKQQTEAIGAANAARSNIFR